MPDPASQVFAGGILEANDLVQVVMIELIIQRLKNLPQFGEVHHPTAVFTNIPTDVDLNVKGMPVNAGAFVASGNMGQVVSGLHLEYSEDVHRRIVPIPPA